MKLISLADFVLEQREDLLRASKNREKAFSSTYLDLIFNYARFLEKPLSIEMFVPYENDTVIEPYERTELEIELDERAACRISSKEEVRYRKAKSKILFVGFEPCTVNSEIGVRDQSHFPLTYSEMATRTIEDISHWNLELTETAIKMFTP